MEPLEKAPFDSSRMNCSCMLSPAPARFVEHRILLTWQQLNGNLLESLVGGLKFGAFYMWDNKSTVNARIGVEQLQLEHTFPIKVSDDVNVNVSGNLKLDLSKDGITPDSISIWYVQPQPQN